MHVKGPGRQAGGASRILDCKRRRKPIADNDLRGWERGETWKYSEKRREREMKSRRERGEKMTKVGEEKSIKVTHRS